MSEQIEGYYEKPIIYLSDDLVTIWNAERERLIKESELLSKDLIGRNGADGNTDRYQGSLREEQKEIAKLQEVIRGMQNTTILPESERPAAIKKSGQVEVGDIVTFTEYRSKGHEIETSEIETSEIVELLRYKSPIFLMDAKDDMDKPLELSVECPYGAALLGKKIGEEYSFRVEGSKTEISGRVTGIGTEHEKSQTAPARGYTKEMATN